MPDVIGRALRIRMETPSAYASFCSRRLTRIANGSVRSMSSSAAGNAPVGAGACRSGLAGWVAANGTIIASPPDLDLVTGVAEAGIRRVSGRRSWRAALSRGG